MATISTKWLKRGAVGLCVIVGTYLIAALLGSIFPANQNWKSPDDGIQIFVETNGFHTGIIMPIWSDVYDWGTLIRPEHMADPSKYGSHILVGWGHGGVYRNARHWKDLRIADALSAVIGSEDTLVHVYHLNYPQAYPHYRRGFKVSEEEYRKIISAILPRFVRDSSGQPQASPGYGDDDLFYRSRGRYSAFYTCNNWTSDVLRQAGIRTAIWSPFQGGVMRWVAE